MESFIIEGGHPLQGTIYPQRQERGAGGNLYHHPYR